MFAIKQINNNKYKKSTWVNKSSLVQLFPAGGVYIRNYQVSIMCKFRWAFSLDMAYAPRSLSTHGLDLHSCTL